MIYRGDFMPKTFSESERIIIQQRLMDAAEECLARFGARKTTVDELVSKAKIPKGTFYLFYDSKELLYFRVFQKLHDDLQSAAKSELAEICSNLNPLELAELIFRLYKNIEDSFLLRFITDGDLEMTLRKLPPEIALEYNERELFSLDHIITSIPCLNPYFSRVSGAALKGVFLSMLHKREIGEEIFDDAIKVMIYGITILMFSGE